MDNPKLPDFLTRVASTNSAEELIGKYAVVCEALQLAAKLYQIAVGNRDPSAEEIKDQVETWLDESQQRLMLVFAPVTDHKN